MKVVLLAPTPPPVGGIAMWTVRMLNAKLNNGWEVQVVDEKILGNREFFGDKVKHNYKMEIKRCLKIWKELNETLKDSEVKVVHACIAANTLPVLREYISACLTKRKKKIFVINFRCTVPNMVKSRLNRIALRSLCKKSDCVMVLNQKSADYIKTLCATEVKLIPNFVERVEVEEIHEINEEIKTVLYVGGVIESKGCVDLIKMAEAYASIEFRMIGNPDSVVKDKARNVQNIKLLGVQGRDVIREEMKKADVFAFLSYFPGEGFSNALAEAMACGLPCLVSDWAANSDMIEGKGGVVVPIKNPEAAIEALRSMMPANVRREQSEFNLRKIQNAYLDEVVLAQYVDCYEELMKKGQNK